MHLLRQQQQQQNQFFCVLLIFLPQLVSIPIKDKVQHIRCNILRENCTSIPHQSPLSYVKFQGFKTQFPRSNDSSWSTTRYRSTTKTNSLSDFDDFSENLKRAAFILAGIALCLGILRICLMLCKSRSGSDAFSNRHSSTVRPQIATIDQQFKPDLPPAYVDAIANIEHGAGKLPSYEELPYEQRQEQYAYNNHGYISTQM